MLKEKFLLTHSIMAETPDFPVVAIDQPLDVTLEVSPAPLKSLAVEVHHRHITATSAALGRLTRNDLLALLGRNRFTKMPLVSFLPPCFRFLPGGGFRFGLACGCSVLGGTEELRGVSFRTSDSN